MAIFMKKKRNKEKGVHKDNSSSTSTNIPYCNRKQTDYSYYGGGKHYNASPAYDKTLTKVDELDKVLITKFEGRRVVILEKLRGTAVRCMFSGKDYIIGSRYTALKNEDECHGATKLFQEYKESIVSISKKVLVPFCLFGEMIGQDIDSDIPYFYSPATREIVFHDLFLNDNWMNWDDFSDLAQEFGLPIVPILGTLVFEEEKVREYLNCYSLKSELPGQKQEGIIIRPGIEDAHYSTRLIAKITTPQFLPKWKSYSYDSQYPTGHWEDGKWKEHGKDATTNVPAKVEKKDEELTEKQKEEAVVAEAKSILDKFVNDARIIYWKHELEIEKIEIKDENVYKIFPILVKNTVSDLLNEVDASVALKNLNKGSLLKELRRELPKRIVKELSLTLPEKIVLGD